MEEPLDCTGIKPANLRVVETWRGTARSTSCHDSRELASSATACKTAGDHQAPALISIQSRISSKYTALKGSICTMKWC